MLRQVSPSAIRDGYQRVPVSDGLAEQESAITRDIRTGAADLEIGELEEKVLDIPEDAYGAGMLALVRDVWRIYRGEEVCVSLVCSVLSLGLLILNLVLQFAILLYVYIYVVRTAMRTVQVQFAHFRTHVHNAEGEFQLELWEDYDELRKKRLCQIPLSDLKFYYSVITCWTLTCMREVKSAHRLFHDVAAMPVCSTSAEMIEHKSDGSEEKIFIVKLTCFTRTLLVLFICVPKFLISIALLWLGCQWLSATTSFTELVLNAVAMEFIINIDEVVYEAMLPRWYQRQVADIDFLSRTYSTVPKAERERAAMWHGTKRTLSYLLASVLWVSVFSQVLQQVLPIDFSEIGTHCRAYIVQSTTPICLQMAYSLGDDANVAECYPFGSSTTSHNEN